MEEAASSPLNVERASVDEVCPLVALCCQSTSLCVNVHLAVLALYASGSQPQQHWEQIFNVLDSNDCISVPVDSLLKALVRRLVVNIALHSFGK